MLNEGWKTIRTERDTPRARTRTQTYTHTHIHTYIHIYIKTISSSSPCSSSSSSDPSVVRVDVYAKWRMENNTDSCSHAWCCLSDCNRSMTIRKETTQEPYTDSHPLFLLLPLYHSLAQSVSQSVRHSLPREGWMNGFVVSVYVCLSGSVDRWMGEWRKGGRDGGMEERWVGGWMDGSASHLMLVWPWHRLCECTERRARV